MDVNGLFRPLELIAGGRPQLLEDEIEVLTNENVTVMACVGQSTDVRLPEGTATLTTHRLLWIGRVGAANANLCCHLQDLRQVRPNPGGLLKSSKKIQVFSNAQQSADEPVAMLSIKTGRDEFLERMQSAIARKAWVKETALDVVTKYVERSGAPAGAGIAGIIQRQEMSRKATSAIASEAFSDINSLMDKAKEVVAVIERYSALLQAQQQQGKDKGVSEQEASDLDNMLLNIGIVSPVTKSSAGTQYHQQLARQLADFLKSRKLLERFGGMMTLPDVYSVLNRARGTELISPLDLLRVSELLAPLGLGMSLHRFSSGVLVIQSDTHNEAAVTERITKMAHDGGSVMATQVSRQLHISVTLAAEHLCTAERSGVLCRDDHIEGVRFFPNMFDVFHETLLRSQQA